MATTSISGPGLLYVNSKITRTDLIDEASYMRWYGDVHIPEILETKVILSAIRFKSTDEAADKPYLVIYPMSDIGSTQEEKFKRISVHSDLLPNGLPVYDLADIDVRYYQLVQVYDPTDFKESRVKVLATAAIEIGDNTTEQDFNDWYTNEHLELISHVPGYLRSTRFKLAYHRTNAQSRVLKGLPPRAQEKDVSVPPTYLALHEFGREDVDMPMLLATGETEWSKRIMGDAQKVESPFFRFEKAYGEKNLFH